MDYRALKVLIDTHPESETVDNDTLYTWLTEEVISRDQTTVSSGEIFATIINNISEWNGLTAQERENVKDILYIHSGEGVPTAAGTPARALLVSILGPNTKVELASTISEMVSRSVAAGILGEITMGAVEYARTI